MSANLKCYTDEACTKEMFYESKSYAITLGPKTGLNGDSGEILDQVFYIKNVGDAVAQNVQIREVGDLLMYFRMSTSKENYVQTVGKIPNIKPGGVERVVLHCIIPKGAEAAKDIVQYTISFYTTPGEIEAQDINNYVQPEHKLQYTANLGAPGLAGRPYGYGPYGDPIYGQEGLIHKTQEIQGRMPIAGLAYTYINAEFLINARYNGTEATIEDIQSYYTGRYMMLGCYDGPALPLWLDQSDFAALK